MESANELCRRTEECLSLFQDASGNEKLADNDWFEDRAADFAWWSHGLKAQKSGRSSLDYRLRDRPDIQKVIAGLLDSLAIALKEYSQPGIDEGQGSTRDDQDDATFESDKSSSDSSWSEFSEEVKESKDKDAAAVTHGAEESHPRFYIETNLKLLAKISIAIRRSGAKLRYLKADAYLKNYSDDDEYTQLRNHLLFVILVGPYEQKLFTELSSRAMKQKIPKAVEIVVRTWIVDPSRATSNQKRLIEANITRRNRIAYARRFIGKNTLPAKRKEATAPTFVPSQFPEGILGLDKQPSTFGADAQELLSIADPIQLPLNAPEPAKSLTAKTFTATELGSQFVLPVIMPFEPKKGAVSIATKITQTGIKQDYPVCPSKKGSFQCPYCVQVLSEDYAVKSRWRGHVAQDLNPYSCIYQDCRDSQNLYATKEEWTKHMKSQHNSVSWACDECIFESENDDEFIFDTHELWESHMRCRHSCRDDRLTLLRSMSKRYLTELAECPLCKRANGRTRPDEDDHIAEHLHSWALRSLPWVLNPDDETSADSPEMGSENDLARMSDMSDHTEDEADRIAATISDAIDREVTRWKHEEPIGSPRLTLEFGELIGQWNAHTRPDTQNEITLQHLISINQIRAQLCLVLQEKSEESEFSAQQRQDIEANLCINIESGIEYMNGILGEKDTELDLGSSVSPFPKVQGKNIHPTDVEVEDILWTARDHVLTSNNVSLQITWARDILTWAEISHESRTRETEYNGNNQPATPYRERTLRLDAVNIITYLSQQEHPEALYMYSKWLEFGKFGHKLDKREAYAGYKRAAELGYSRSEYRMGMMYEQSNDLLKAREHYHSGVALNDSASLYRVGMMSLLGHYDMIPDYVTGLERIRAAADSSDDDAPQGAYVYGMIIARDLPDLSHLDKNNIPEDLLPNDPLKAKMYIEKSAFLGFAKAQLKMGRAYEFGELGCSCDPAYSIHHYGLAAKQGEPEAALGVSRWFLKGHEGSFEKNEALAYKYAQQAAAAKLAAGEFALGYYNEVGIHVEKNLEEARKWFQKSADHGNRDAIGRLESLHDRLASFHETKGKTLSTMDDNIPDGKTETALLPSKFPKVTGDNIPPTDDEKWDRLKEARENLSNSGNLAARLTWARDVLTWVIIAEKVRCRDPESPLAPESEQQLKADALFTINGLAAQSFPEALYHQGKWYEFGHFGRPVDPEEAARRYRQSAEGGFARAEYRLGRIHQRQPEEWETALEHYKKAQSQDDSAANCHLGLMQSVSSHQKEPDLEKVLVLLQKSADSADEDAPQGAYVYGMAIVRELKDFVVDESLLPIDRKKAFSYIEKGANLGYARAQLKMGEVYEYGLLGCSLDIAKALHYYHLAARRGSAEAASVLSYSFWGGIEGVLPQDPELSFKFAQLGTIEDQTGAKYMMGTHYERGTYVQQDLGKARQWYRLASRYTSVRGRFDYLSKTAIKRLEYIENEIKLLEDRQPEDVDQSSPEPFSKPRTIMVGIDLGSVFSSVSWTYSSGCNEIYQVQDWPNTATLSEPDCQVPTQYDLQTREWGNPTLQASQLRKSANRFPQNSCFSALRDLASSVDQVHTKAAELLTAYLEALWKHAVNDIFSSTSPWTVKFIISLSVPVDFSGVVQERLRRAARAAIALCGASQVIEIMLVGQMEASILYALKAEYRLAGFPKRPSIAIKNGGIITICDCGGTGARSISYEVPAQSPLMIQLTTWNRDVYSAQSADTEFLDYLLNRSGFSVGTSERAQEALDLFIQTEWEYGIKRTFRGDEKSDIVLQLPRKATSVLGRLRRSSKTLLIKPDTIFKFFERSLAGIEMVIDAQLMALEALGKKPNSILLVGGLAQSPCVIYYLHQKYNIMFHLSHSTAAVSQGVVEAGLQRLLGLRSPVLAELEDQVITNPELE